MKTTIGIFAHVDAGKTTLSEQLLYKAGAIRACGRVDAQNTTLDYDETERRRGITVFSDVARFTCGENTYFLVDTPGHIDFVPQAERAVAAVDYAIWVISAADGIQAHTKTLWHFLKRAQKPVFIFINKTDMPTADVPRCLSQLADTFGDCLNFSQDCSEELALYDEELLELYMTAPQDLRRHPRVAELVRRRKLFPCFCGSALRDVGIDDLLCALGTLACTSYDDAAPFAAQVFKVRHEADGSRVAFLKIQSGTLHAKDKLMIGQGDNTTEEKVNEIRFYMGGKFQAAATAAAGDVCGVCGLSVMPGTVLGAAPALEPSAAPPLRVGVTCSDDISPRELLRIFRILENEEPSLSVEWNEEVSDLQIHIMGTIQLEVIAEEVERRFGLSVSFGDCKIMYRETIAAPVFGYGHFEPLRHYAEVHLLLSPLPCGSGIVFESDLSTDMLTKNYQNLIRTHVYEKPHRGTLTGAPITDIKITLINGKSHEKHTVGGDFREATYRAVRQGLFSAECILLEPLYAFEMTAPVALIGKLMTDIQRMYGTVNPPQEATGDLRLLTGTVPVAEALQYPAQLAADTGGTVQIMLRPCGYAPCHNAQAVIEATAYEKERDLQNPAGSVFVDHGSTLTVPWNEMESAIHLEKPNKALLSSIPKNL